MSGSTSLLTACRIGDHAAAAHCLAQYTSAAASAVSAAERTKISLAINVSEVTGWCPLLYAARNAWSDIVESLLDLSTLLHTHARLSSSGNTGKAEAACQ
jgi:ankyrin repeat protein